MNEKRRLPSWMKGASTADKVSKPLDLDANDVITKEEVNVGPKSTKPKAKTLTLKHKKEAYPFSDDNSFLVKCKTKRKKTEIVEENVTESHDFKQELVLEKKKVRRVRRKVEEPINSRKREENTAPSSDEEDEDLTMEDLLSIAKQFVENDKSDTDQQKSHKRKSSHTSSSVSRISLNTPQNTKSPIQEETALHHESTENTRSEITLEDKTMTGDPAQDMLDLLLGPLLKKPVRKEESTSIKDMVVTHEVKNQQYDAVVSNKPVTLTKKKSSLRDAVAMLLD
ncbi:hypothetical protein L1887_29981 [Cichorium endivia]|nr:hypothetical protein L1887_29981 [Cichorium endivia]